MEHSGTDDFETNFDFDTAREELDALGLPYPDTPATQRIVGVGGSNCRSLYGVSLEQLFDAVQSVHFPPGALDDTVTQTTSVPDREEAYAAFSASKETFPLPEPSSSQHPSIGADAATGVLQNVPRTQTTCVAAANSTHAGPQAPLVSRAHTINASTVPTGPVRRYTGRTSRSKKANRVLSYFEEIASQDPNRTGRFESVCLQCDYVVNSTETRYKLFHVILCCNIPFSVRLGIYFTSNDKMKPPLIEALPRHCEPFQARIIVQKQTESLKELIEGYLSRRDDLSRDHALARRMLAKAGVKMQSRIDECTADETKIMSSLLMDFIVEENVPFAVCGSRDYMPRPFGRLLSYARPGYKMPSSNKIAGDILSQYYTVVKSEIQRRLKSMIPEQCRVTIMFDGSEDVRNQPLINVLMRVMGRSRGSVKTYFLKSVYTGYDTNASYYVNMVEEVVKEFGGFESIAGVVTDNTASVLKARDMLEQKYSRLVASQDQAHVSNLLMGDIGQIAWISETLESVASIGTYLRRFRKLRAKVVEMMEKHNVEVRKILTAMRQDDRQRKLPGETCTQDESRCYDGDEFEGGNVNREPGNVNEDDQNDKDDEDENSDVDDDAISSGDAYSSADESGGQPKAPRLVTVSNIFSSQIQSAVREIGHGHEEEEDIVTASADQLRLNPSASVNSCAGDVSRFACIMKKVSAVRFASLEKLLKEYKSLRKVLLALVSNEDFKSLCSLKTAAERSQLEQNFTLPIKDDDLYHRVVQVHAIMKACRLYLRMFDSESCLISEVVRATTMLEQTIRNLPPECFPEPCLEHHQQLLEIFRNRKEGPIPGYKKVKITLISDLHVAAALLDPYRCPFDISAHKERLRDHLEKYLCGSGAVEFRNELDKDEFIVEMMNQYDIVHSLWKQKGYVRADSERTSVAERREVQSLPSLRQLRERSPISWWTAGSLRLPREGFAKRAAKALVEFAVRALSVSPTATATERTFSHLSRIQPKQRSGFSREKVEKLLFCQWNLRVLRKVANAYELDIQSEAKKQNSGINQLRAHRKHVTTMSFRGSLRIDRVTVQPTRPVTAENEPLHVTRTSPLRLRIEADNVSPRIRRPSRDITLAAPEVERTTTEQQVVRALSPRAGAFVNSPYDVRKASDGDGPGVVPLGDVLRAAVDIDYSMSRRQREQGSNPEQRIENIREVQSVGMLQHRRITRTKTNIPIRIAQAKAIEGDREIETEDDQEELGMTRKSDDRGHAEQGTSKRPRLDPNEE